MRRPAELDDQDRGRRTDWNKMPTGLLDALTLPEYEPAPRPDPYGSLVNAIARIRTTPRRTWWSRIRYWLAADGDRR